MDKNTFDTTNISLATAMLCADYTILAGAGNTAQRVTGCNDVKLEETVVITEAGRCKFVLGYTKHDEFFERMEAFEGGLLMVPPIHYDKRKKIIVDAMREARKEQENN